MLDFGGVTSVRIGAVRSTVTVDPSVVFVTVGPALPALSVKFEILRPATPSGVVFSTLKVPTQTVSVRA